MTASFANKQFFVSEKQIRTFSNFSFDIKLNTQKQENENGKPQTKIKGEDLVTFKISIPLSVDFGLSPLNEFNSWRNIMVAKTAYPFILGLNQFGGCKFLLISVSASETVISNNGNMLSCLLELSFEEYAAIGTSGGTVAKKSNAPAIEENKEVSDNYKLNQYSKDEKGQIKRPCPTSRLRTVIK